LIDWTGTAVPLLGQAAGIRADWEIPQNRNLQPFSANLQPFDSKRLSKMPYSASFEAAPGCNMGVFLTFSTIRWYIASACSRVPEPPAQP
jgi:hypothetical protein